MRNRLILSYLILSYLILSYLILSPLGAGKKFTAKVIGISDGDTITVLRNDKPVKIRLYGIDTPEKKQAFGTKAKQFTSNFAFGKFATVYPGKIDRYGRTIAIIKVGDNNLNEALVINGYAWVYRKYCKKSFCRKFLLYESEARKAKIGLWSQEAPIQPKEYRKGKRRKK